MRGSGADRRGLGTGVSFRHLVSSFSLYLLFASPAGALVVRTHDADVEGRILRLGDIAEVLEASESERTNLLDLQLGYAPPPGARRQIPLETIRMHILALGINPRELKIEGASPFVNRSGQKLEGEVIAEHVLEILKERHPGIDFEVARAPESIMLPVGQIELAIEPPSRIARSFAVNVEAGASGESIKAYVSMRGIRTEEVAVAKRLVERGRELTADDIEIRKIDTLGDARGFVKTLADAVGRAAKRTLAEGTPITAGDVEAVRMVNRGDKVTIVVRESGLTITTPGEAFSAGGIGETIRVRNIESKKILSGRITGPGEVTIVY